MSRLPNGSLAYGYAMNGSNPSIGSSQPSIAMNGAAMNSQTRLGTMSRAERFEDEKRRIIESCFSKLDQNGQLAESYITHIRVQEDALYPSTPSPPDSNPDSKKPRLIIIAVRSTGRVRMHKARENNNGSFSIGKTWNLEELAVIESYSSTAAPPQSELEAQNRAWAGSVGFTVTITKPYYWQAGTAKEKEFFIASAVKIYRKYTKGQIPELRGFDEAQKATMLGSLPGQQSPPPGDPPPLASREQDGSASPVLAPPQPAFAQESSRDRSRYRDAPGSPGGMSDRAGSRPQSPAHFGPNSQDSYVPKPFAEQPRSYSPVSFTREPRPSTGNGQSGQPPPQLPRDLSQQSSQSQYQAESPVTQTFSTARDGWSKQSQFVPPPRKASAQSNDGVTQERSVTQERNMPQERSLPTSPPPPSVTVGQQYNVVQPRGRDQSPSLPPIETMPLAPFTGSWSTPPASAAPKTSSSVSTPGIGDPSAFASVSGYMGPEQSVAGATLSSNSPSDVPTPARPQRRPTLEATMSDPIVETLRPAPLNPSSNQRAMTPDGTSTYATPREGMSPSTEQPPVITQTKNNSDTNLSVPGAMQRSALAPSPLSTPAQTPGHELDEDGMDRQPEEEYRPGLGPMIKRKAVADRLKRAAQEANTFQAANSAFKPRKGGAAERILKAKAEREAGAEPDGITGVVPRPSLKSGQKTEDLAVKEPSGPPPKVEVSATSPTGRYEHGMDGSRGIDLHDDAAQVQTPDEKTRDAKEKLEQRQIRQVKVKRRDQAQERYLDYLGVERSLLADKCLDFEMMLHDFGWDNAALSRKALTEMETDLRREQSRLDAGSWISAPSHETNLRLERENQVMSLLDKAIQECDEMDGLLTIYNVELSSLNDDIAYIEAQSQGLQVQAANQRNLQTELTNLVQTLSLDRRSLDSIRNADLSSSRGIDDAEQSLKKLYSAIITINPNIRSNAAGRPKSRGGTNEGNELTSMAAVRMKQDAYLQQSEVFCQRLVQHLDYMFTTSFNNAKNEALVPATGSAGGMRLNPEAYTTARQGLWIYSPLLLFMKELNVQGWQKVVKTYSMRARPLYADAFGQNVAGWKRVVRKPTGEEGEILFTAQEKEEPASGGVVSSARKLTVKRSQTLAKTLRKASDDRPGSSDGRSSGGLHSCDVFSGAMDEMAPLISQEQNFVVDMFHTTSLETSDFMDVVAATPPDHRLPTNLVERKPMDPDREMARNVTGIMEEIFGFFTNELSKLLDWSVSMDPIQGVGVMACLSRHSYFLQDSSQEFLVQLTDTLMARLQNLFAKFVDEQVRAIEDTKIKIKKRKGVIGFMRIFPHFAAAVENTFASVGQADYEQDADCMTEVRKRVDEAYTRINRAMFDSLKVIAKESPTSAPQGPRVGIDDLEDKEKLNYNVLIVENMNHYIEEVDDGGRRSVLAEWKGRAEMERSEAMDSYIGQVVRRPLGKLLEFLDSIDSVKASHPNNPAGVTSRPSFSRKSVRNLLSQYDTKEIRRGIEHLRGRIEKHFGVGDDESICRALVALVDKACEKAYETTVDRVEEVIREFYPNVEGEKPVELEFSKADVQTAFRNAQNATNKNTHNTSHATVESSTTSKSVNADGYFSFAKNARAVAEVKSHYESKVERKARKKKKRRATRGGGSDTGGGGNGPIIDVKDDIDDIAPVASAEDEQGGEQGEEQGEEEGDEEEVDDDDILAKRQRPELYRDEQLRKCGYDPALCNNAMFEQCSVEWHWLQACRQLRNSKLMKDTKNYLDAWTPLLELANTPEQHSIPLARTALSPFTTAGHNS